MSESALAGIGGSGISYCGTIDGVFAARDDYSGVNVSDLRRGTVVYVDTKNSQYRLVTLNGTRRLVAVLGGRCRNEETVARLCLSRLGESMLKVGWIGVGFRLELEIDGRVMVTSPVRSITIEEPACRVA